LGRVVGDHVLRAVLQEQEEGVPAAVPALGQLGRKAIDRVAEFPVGEPCAVVVDRDAVRSFRRVVGDVLVERLLPERKIRFARNPVRKLCGCCGNHGHDDTTNT